MRRFLCYVSMLSLLAACAEDYTPSDSPSKLVVEGWIEDGGFPVVILTKTFPVNSEIMREEDLSDYMLRWAKVTVSDGEDSVVLTGKYDAGYFPPYIYTTSRLRGMAGKRYTLTVEYRDEKATAVTTIPQAPADCSFVIEKCASSDTLYQMTARFEDNPDEKNYYQFFTRVGSQTKQYLAAYLGSIDDEVIGNGMTEVPVYRGHQLGRESYTPYYSIDDTVSVKFAQVDETSFRIWDNYTKILSLSGNLFLPVYTTLPTNIIGGYGYWCGYGAVTKYFVIHENIK